MATAATINRLQCFIARLPLESLSLSLPRWPDGHRRRPGGRPRPPSRHRRRPSGQWRRPCGRRPRPSVRCRLEPFDHCRHRRGRRSRSASARSSSVSSCNGSGSWRGPNRRYRAGRTKRLTSVEVTKPPSMTTAIGCTSSRPAISPSTRAGSRKSAVAIAAVNGRSELLLRAAGHEIGTERHAILHPQVPEAVDEHDVVAHGDGQHCEQARHGGQGHRVAIDPGGDYAARQDHRQHQEGQDGQPPAPEDRLQEEEDADGRGNGEDRQPSLRTLLVARSRRAPRRGTRGRSPPGRGDLARCSPRHRHHGCPRSRSRRRSARCPRA